MILIHAVALLVLAICVMFAQWQWHRAHVIRVNQQALVPTQFEQLSIAKDFLPVSSIGAKTYVSGRWQPQSRFYLSGRPADGRLLIDTPSNRQSLESVATGFWIVDLLKISDGTSVAIVRGWNPDQKGIEAETGTQKISGTVQPSEDAPGENLVPVDELLTTERILQHSTTNVRDGFIVQSNPPKMLQEVIPTRLPADKNELHWRNVVYTINWIFFGLLAVLMWIRVVREETTERNTTSAS